MLRVIAFCHCLPSRLASCPGWLGPYLRPPLRMVATWRLAGFRHGFVPPTRALPLQGPPASWSCYAEPPLIGILSGLLSKYPAA
eukprot:2400894-Alexandrium_andersonii.AAC.1